MGLVLVKYSVVVWYSFTPLGATTEPACSRAVTVRESSSRVPSLPCTGKRNRSMGLLFEPEGIISRLGCEAYTFSMYLVTVSVSTKRISSIQEPKPTVELMPKKPNCTWVYFLLVMLSAMGSESNTQPSVGWGNSFNKNQVLPSWGER